MKIFPHILSRVGGLPIEELKEFEVGYYDTIKILLRKERHLLVQKLKVENEFHRVIESAKTPFLKSILKNILIDFRKGRNSYVKKLIRIKGDEVRELIDLVASYDNGSRIRNNIKSDLRDLYEGEINRSYALLQKLGSDENFQKGILQSSQSIYQRILSFQKKDVEDFRKKERQTARSLAQYIFRTATKTSPFSHFTTLDLMSLKDGEFQSEKKDESDSFFQYNHFLLLELKEQLLTDLFLCKKISVELNSSIIQNDDEFCFIKNNRNVETFQKLEKSDFLNLIHDKINTRGETFEGLIKKLNEVVDAEEDELTNYLMGLIDVGFIEFRWDVKSTGRKWVEQLSNWLEVIDPKENFFIYHDLLIDLFLKKEQILFCSPQIRLELQNKFINVLKRGGFSKTRPEIILFEDVLTPHGFSLTEDEVNPIIRSLDGLLYLMEPLMQNEMKLKIRFLWEKHFANKTSIPLLKFYELFFQEDFDDVERNDQFIDQMKERWKKIISTIGKMSNEGGLHFSMDEIRKNISGLRIANYKYSGLFQFFKDKGKTKAIINGLSPGYGKLFGRFLHMFPDEITKELQEWNKEVNGGYVIAENTDASYYNVNLHPPLVSHEIKMHNSQNKLPSQNQIPISEIEIREDKGGTEFHLFSSKTQKHIEIVDLGFENPKARSPMFQLLNGFRHNHATYRIFLEMVNEIYVQENENGIRFYPRVMIDDHLILQRQSQIIDVSFFPKINKNDHAADFFYQMQKFKDLHNLPQFVFVQPIRDFSNPENILKQDFYKPQFIDLHAPLSVEILKSIIQKHQGKIKVEEMLPMPNQLDTEYVREDVIEWKRN